MPDSALFAVVDCAADPALFELTRRLGPGRAMCLFRGELDPRLRAASPHLVKMSHDSQLYAHWFYNGRGKSWGIWLHSRSELPRIWRRLRHYTQARLPSGEGPVLFRFWDPRVLRSYLPLVPEDELPGWFSEVDAYIVEGPDNQHSLSLSMVGGRLQSTSVQAFGS